MFCVLAVAPLRKILVEGGVAGECLRIMVLRRIVRDRELSHVPHAHTWPTRGIVKSTRAMVNSRNPTALATNKEEQAQYVEACWAWDSNPGPLVVSPAPSPH